ncbi:MAG: hypothetical protein WCX90_08525 [Thiohalomonadaceae bacterium]
MSSSLTLVFPHSPPAVPALTTLLARSDRHAIQPVHWSQHVLQLGGLDYSPDQDLPLGPLCALGDGLQLEDGYWLCVEPVHLLADQDQLYLASRAKDLAVTTIEAETLAAEFNALYLEDGWQLFTPCPERWYLRLPKPLMLHTKAPDGLEGYSLWQAQPHGRDALLLQAAVNEMQMLLHNSAINNQRRRENKATINSLWLWAGGQLPALVIPWQQIQGDNCLLRGIARLDDVSHVVEGMLDWRHGNNLCVLTGEFDYMDGHWFASLLSALQRGELTELNIYCSGSSYRYCLDRRAARRWWRRRRPKLTEL